MYVNIARRKLNVFGCVQEPLYVTFDSGVQDTCNSMCVCDM